MDWHNVQDVSRLRIKAKYHFCANRSPLITSIRSNSEIFQLFMSILFDVPITSLPAAESRNILAESGLPPALVHC